VIGDFTFYLLPDKKEAFSAEHDDAKKAVKYGLMGKTN
jgi:hypothetical protein